ncbi:MAG TPA: hypothetical protein PK156_37580, partial [Polyangium sp.]|nr:hypothetical protein [Polyangium sp.]
MSRGPIKRPPAAHNKNSTPVRDWLGDAASKAPIPANALLAVREWLGEQFTGDEHAQLGHTGHDDTKIPLGRVFVDLPMTTQSSGMVEPNQPTTPFLEDLLQFQPQSIRQLRAACSTNPLGIPGLAPLDFERPRFAPPFPELLVEQASPKTRRRKGKGDASICESLVAGTILIGGPGQGKSTLCQLLCQLHRATLLRGFPNLKTTVRDVLDPFIDQIGQSTIRLPTHPLFPLRILLPDASTWRARMAQPGDISDDVPWLLSFLASKESAKRAQCTAETLATWLRAMPSLVLLDGFDEIGAEEDRRQIVAAIQDLVALLEKYDTTSTIVATTRPQGYMGELTSITVPMATRYLAFLQTHEALHYADKLIDAKIKGNVDERQRVKNNLLEASQEPNISRLLQTPLQVTILAGLVENTRPPSERWKLFEKYLKYVYAREANRSTTAKELLNNREAQILSIHARAALLLQVEAEVGGGASSRLPRDRFAAIVTEVLQEDGLAGEELDELVTKIVRVAEQRLVFLVEPELGFVGFEIRSLQEFMAAWALVQDVPEEQAKKRILQIAKAPMFRNVLVFIASKVFGTSRSDLRTYLAKDVCAHLNADPSDPLARVVRAGSWLALEMLEEGAVLPLPKYAAELMRHAAQLLDLP